MARWEIPKKVGDRIRLARDALGLKTSDLTRLTGFESNRISALFKRKTPLDPEEAEKLCEAFAVGHAYLYRGMLASDTSNKSRDLIIGKLVSGWQPREQIGRGRPPKSGGHPRPRETDEPFGARKKGAARKQIKPPAR